MAKLDTYYVKHIKGILKILELVAACLSFTCMLIAGNGLTYLRNETYKSRYDFFLASHIVGSIVMLIVFIVHLVSLHDILGTTKIWNYLNLVFCIILTFFCELSAGLMIVYAEKEYSSYYFKTDLGRWRWYASNRIAAVVFGFINGVMYIIDILVQIIDIRSTHD